MNMTKKDYVLIAQAIKAQLQIDREDNSNPHAIRALNELALILASQLKADNPKFNEDRFLTACGF